MKGREKGNSDCHIPNDAYREGWDRIFGEKEPVPVVEEWEEETQYEPGIDDSFYVTGQ